MLVIFIIYYIWAQVGDFIFGGKVFYGNMDLLTNPNVDQLYYLMNMNDLAASFITLFALMVVNNWFVIVLTFTAVLGDNGNYYRWYFILFYIVCVNIILNIIVAFVLDTYSNMADI